jgi:hypothetical protein
MDAGVEHSIRADKGWDRRLGHQRQRIRIADPGPLAAEELARMGLELGYCRGGQLQRVARRLVGTQRGQWGLRRRGLLPSRNRSRAVRQVV